MKSQIEASYTGADGNVSWSASADIKVGGGLRGLVHLILSFLGMESKHEVNIVDSSALSNSVLGMVNAIGGSKVDINAGIINVSPGQQGNASFDRTSAHEFGHLGGLLHPATPNSNLMTQTWASGSTSVDKQQIESMHNDYKAANLNQGLW